MLAAIFFIIFINMTLGLAAGAIMYRSGFCVAGMFRDLFLFKRKTMLRSLLLLVVASMVLFDVLRQTGLLPDHPFPLLAPPSIANIAGGVIFGIGMVLAGGCVVGTLYKMGGGSVVSATAFAGLILGSGIYAEIHPWWAGIIKKYSFLKDHITVPQAMGCDPTMLILPLTLLSVFCFHRWYKRKIWMIESPAENFLQPWKAALYLSVLGAISYLLVGMPFGITTAYAKMAAFLTKAVAPGHVSDIAFYNGVPLNFSAPISHITLTGGAGPFMDAIAYIQFPLILGIILGATVTALRLGEFKLYFKVPMRQYASALIGGVILALGSRMTPGCNIWHLFGGLPILNMQSILFVAGIIPGSYIGSQILIKVVLPSGT